MTTTNSRQVKVLLRDLLVDRICPVHVDLLAKATQAEVVHVVEGVGHREALGTACI